APTHGDFYADQVVVEAGVAGLLDLDEASLFDPAGDLGNFAARLERETLLGRQTSTDAERRLALLLDGYGGPAFEPPLTLYKAIGLLKHATAPFRERHEAWPEEIGEILARTEALLGAPRRVTVSDRFRARKDPALP